MAKTTKPGPVMLISKMEAINALGFSSYRQIDRLIKLGEVKIANLPKGFDVRIVASTVYAFRERMLAGV